MAIIERYEAIAEASSAMLRAARAGNWREVASVEGFCIGLVDELKSSRTMSRLSLEERRRKRELIRGILTDDAEIRHLLEPQITRMGVLIKLSGLDQVRRYGS